MPRCEGCPNGPCPASRNDQNDQGVRNTQGNLFLCKAYENFRTPPVSVKPSWANKDEMSSGTRETTMSSSSNSDKLPSLIWSGRYCSESSACCRVGHKRTVQQQTDGTYSILITFQLLSLGHYCLRNVCQNWSRSGDTVGMFAVCCDPSLTCEPWNCCWPGSQNWAAAQKERFPTDWGQERLWRCAQFLRRPLGSQAVVWRR